MINALTVGRVAKAANVNVETIRYYERRGLLPPPNRRSSGYRIYGDETVDRIKFIQNGKELGFTLNEIAELFDLQVNSTRSCNTVQNMAEAKLSDIRSKIQVLQHVERALSKLASECHGSGPKGACPILDAMDATNKIKESLK